MPTWTVQISGSGVVNGTKNYTISDADLQTIINHWTTKFAAATPGAALVAGVQDWINLITLDTQHAGTTLNVPPPVTFT